MTDFAQYLIPYVLSQVVAIGILVCAIFATRLARLLFVLLFVWAACTNMYFGLTNPDIYLDYAPLAVPLYRRFILGWFSHYHHILIPLIAIGQFLIGVGMALRGKWVQWACIWAMIFFAGIAPLLVGSGFPFSLITLVAAWLVLRKDAKNYLWRKPKQLAG